MTTTLAPVHETTGKASQPTPFSEAFASQAITILERLGLRRGESMEQPAALGLTSCLPAEGVSTIAAEISVAAARQFQIRTVLVDCHFDRPSVHRLFGIGLCPGLDNVLEHELPLGEVIRASGIEGLSLIPAGTVRKEGDAFLSAKIEPLMTELRAEFDLLVFDLPTLSTQTPIRSGSLLDGVLLVVEAERVEWQTARRATTSLKAAGATLLGAVLNKRRTDLPPWLGGTPGR
jgi:Mrp family chromosome partitioning ATPase